jgi:hypothetical protein
VDSKRQIIKAMAVIRRRRDGALLVSESDDPLFQRPLGGHVGEQLILDNPDRRVLWRPADAQSPPLYPAGLSELLAALPLDAGPADAGPIA